MAQQNRANGGANDTKADDNNVRYHVRLPRFIVHEPVGVGQVVKRVTGAVGVKPCAPCEQRAARLDRWLRIEPRH
jgi:hypothetical protein